MEFEKFWQYLQNNLRKGDIIKNWSRDGLIRIKEFTVTEVDSEYIKVMNTNMKVKKEHFKYVYENWYPYINYRLDRHQIRDKIRTSAYVIAIIHHFKE